jgi:hypothetical protein
MARAGLFVAEPGLLVFALGSALLAWVLACSPDARANPVGNGLLLTLSWWVGGALFGLGLRAATARAAHRH